MASNYLPDSQTVPKVIEADKTQRLFAKNEGYNVKFVDVMQIREDEYCPICFLVMRKPMLVIQCGHSFCKACLDNWIVSCKGETRCPLDNNSIESNGIVPDLKLQRVLGSLQVYCENWDRGCEHTPELRDLLLHTEKCQYRNFSCLMCGKVVALCLLDDHTEECPNKLTRQMDMDAFNKLTENIESLRGQMEHAMTKIANVEVANYVMNCEMEASREMNSTLTSRVDKLTESQAQIAEALSKVKKEKVNSVKELERVKKQKDKMSNEIGQLKKENVRLSADIVGLKRANGNIMEDAKVVADKIEELRGGLANTNCFDRFPSTGELPCDQAGAKPKRSSRGNVYTIPAGTVTLKQDSGFLWVSSGIYTPQKYQIMLEMVKSSPWIFKLTCYVIKGVHDAELLWPWREDCRVGIEVKASGREVLVYERRDHECSRPIKSRNEAFECTLSCPLEICVDVAVMMNKISQKEAASDDVLIEQVTSFCTESGRKTCPFTWRVLLQAEKTTGSSEPFITACGYSVHFTVESCGENEYIVCCFLLKGDRDEELVWPWVVNLQGSITDPATGRNLTRLMMSQEVGRADISGVLVFDALLLRDTGTFVDIIATET